MESRVFDHIRCWIASGFLKQGDGISTHRERERERERERKRDGSLAEDDFPLQTGSELPCWPGSAPRDDEVLATRGSWPRDSALIGVRLNGKNQAEVCPRYRSNMIEIINWRVVICSNEKTPLGQNMPKRFKMFVRFRMSISVARPKPGGEVSSNPGGDRGGEQMGHGRPGLHKKGTVDEDAGGSVSSRVRTGGRRLERVSRTFSTSWRL